MKSFKFNKILKNLGKRNIVIMGHMGSGKTVIGKFLAKKLVCKHLDSDSEIIKITNKNINKIFKEHGEKYFRELEKKVLFNLLEKRNVVISLGGGSILDSSTREKLFNNSLTIFLEVSLKELQKRLERSKNRPLLKNTNLGKKLKELDTFRRKYYLRADIKIKNIDNIYNISQNLIENINFLNEKNSSNKN